MLTLLLSLTANATTLASLSLDQLADAADTIVRGTVTEVWTEPDDAGLIWTLAQVEVAAVFKGADRAVLVVSQPGGTWGDRQTHVSGVARFSVGEDAWLFAEQRGEDRVVLVGMFQGKFNTIMDPYAQAPIVTRFPVSAATHFDHRFIPLPPEDARITAVEFEAELIEQVSNGWDGRPVPGLSTEQLEQRNRLR